MFPPTGSPPKLKLICMYLPKRLELSFLVVFAHPSDSSTQLLRRRMFFTLNRPLAPLDKQSKGLIWKLNPHSQDSCPRPVDDQLRANTGGRSCVPAKGTSHVYEWDSKTFLNFFLFCTTDFFLSIPIQ